MRTQYPEVEKALLWLLQYAPARLTGTGACVFAEFDDEKSAQAVFQQKPKEFFGFVAKGLKRFTITCDVETTLDQPIYLHST